MALDAVRARFLESDLVQIQRLEKFAHDEPWLLISRTVDIERSLVDWKLELLLLYISILKVQNDSDLKLIV